MDVDRTRALDVAVLAVLVGLVVLAGVQYGLVPVPGLERHETACAFAGTGGDDHDAARVTFLDGDRNRTLATVDARVSDTDRERCVGLSATDSLPAGSGMLFVHREERSLTYVMRGMEYGLDIVFVGADGRVTAVRHARPPRPGENGERIRRTGTGKYVVELPRGYANATGIDAGDRVRIEYTG